jgi:hypothetical protein
MNRVRANEYKTVPFQECGHGSWVEEWSFHQGCNERICFTGFLTELFAPDQEYFVRYTVLRKNAPEKQLLKILITDLKSGESYSYEEEEFISMDEVGAVRTNSSMIVPDFEHPRLFLHARTEEFSMRFHMMTDRVPVWADTVSHPVKRYSWNNLDAKGVLFFHQKDGPTKMVRCKGKMWFDKGFGPRKEIGAFVRSEWISVQFLERRETEYRMHAIL